MAALTAFRDTPTMGSNGPIPPIQVYPVKGSTKVFAGSLVALNAGFAAPGATATGRIAVGKAIGPAPSSLASGLAGSTADNSGGADGAISVYVQPGVHRWGNSSAGDAIAQADVGAQCFIVDDQTVAKTSATNTRSVAGIIVQVDSAGVWVLTGLGVNS